MRVAYVRFEGFRAVFSTLPRGGLKIRSFKLGIGSAHARDEIVVLSARMGHGGAVVSSVHTQAARRMTSEKAPASCCTKEEVANRSDPDSEARCCCMCVTSKSNADPSVAGKKSMNELHIIT